MRINAKMIEDLIEDSKGEALGRGGAQLYLAYIQNPERNLKFYSVHTLHLDVKKNLKKN